MTLPSFGTEAKSLTTLDSDIKVVVKLNIANSNNVTSDSTNTATIDSLNRISIPTRDGDAPLSSLVSVSLRESSTIINHEDSERTVLVTADVTSEGNTREIQAEVLSRINSEIIFHEGVRMSSGGGETDDSNSAFIEMFIALVV